MGALPKNLRTTSSQAPQVTSIERTVTFPEAVRTPGRVRTAQLTSAYAPNECTVVDRYVSPGRSTVDGNPGLFGESGKCWVSRASPSPWR